jgi:hypothetical protein
LTPASRFPTAEFKRAVEAGDVEGIVRDWTEDCVVRAPGTDRVQFEGKDAARAFWTAVRATTGHFEYTEEIRSDDTIALFLRARFSDREFEAIDFLRIDEQGRCREMFVTFGPPTTVSIFSGRVALALSRPGDLIRRSILSVLVWPLELTVRLLEPVRARLVRTALRLPARSRS